MKIRDLLANNQGQEAFENFENTDIRFLPEEIQYITNALTNAPIGYAFVNFLEQHNSQLYSKLEKQFKSNFQSNIKGKSIAHLPHSFLFDAHNDTGKKAYEAFHQVKLKKIPSVIKQQSLANGGRVDITDSDLQRPMSSALIAYIENNYSQKNPFLI